MPPVVTWSVLVRSSASIAPAAARKIAPRPQGRAPCTKRAPKRLCTLRTSNSRDARCFLYNSIARTLHDMRILLVIATIGFVMLAACGSSGTPPKCNGTTCSCPSGQSCELAAGTCGNSCSLDCSNSNDCTGQCGDSCSLKCTGSSTCAMMVGSSGSVDCSGGATCHIKCTGSCSIDCGGGSTCDLQCPSDSAPKSIGTSGACG